MAFQWRQAWTPFLTGLGVDEPQTQLPLEENVQPSISVGELAARGPIRDGLRAIVFGNTTVPAAGRFAAIDIHAGKNGLWLSSIEALNFTATNGFQVFFYPPTGPAPQVANPQALVVLTTDWQGFGIFKNAPQATFGFTGLTATASMPFGSYATVGDLAAVPFSTFSTIRAGNVVGPAFAFNRPIYIPPFYWVEIVMVVAAIAFDVYAELEEPYV